MPDPYNGQMWRRWSLALGLSALAHIAVLIAALGLGAARPSGPIDIEITGMRLDELKDVPLGGPPAANGAGGRAKRRAPNRADRKPATGPAPKIDDRKQEGARTARNDDNKAPAPTADLGAYGPQGSRLTVLLRLDRMRGTDYASVVDALVDRLPDRHDLLDGTGLDLFQSFDALLIATPHPLDPTVTFLAARHHIDETALRQALDRGARATNRLLVWHQRNDRPFAERRWRGLTQPPTGKPDDRLIVLAAPNLVVVTPPAYRALLLGRSGADSEPPDGGGPSSRDGSVAADPDHVGSTDGGEGRPAAALDWAELLDRIDAEAGLVPPDGMAMVRAVDIFKRSGASAGEAPPILYGMPVPSNLDAVVGVGERGPFLRLDAAFSDEVYARQWEARWPDIQRRLETNPYVLLSGFGGLVSRMNLTTNRKTIHAELVGTHDEALRLLELAVHLLGGA
jgi:hypothetical protein